MSKSKAATTAPWTASTRGYNHKSHVGDTWDGQKKYLDCQEVKLQRHNDRSQLQQQPGQQPGQQQPQPRANLHGRRVRQWAAIVFRPTGAGRIIFNKPKGMQMLCIHLNFLFYFIRWGGKKKKHTENDKGTKAKHAYNSQVSWPSAHIEPTDTETGFLALI